MYLTKAPSWYSIVVCLLKNMMGGKNKKGGSKMKTQKNKINLIFVGKVATITSLFALSVYFGIPQLSVWAVLSLLCLAAGFTCLIKWVK